MPNEHWKILLVEDDKEDYLLTKEMLSESREHRYTLEWASDYEAGKEAACSRHFDSILMDYQLGPMSGLNLTRELHASGCKTPIILLTGRGNYHVDIEAMQIGVTDYLAKSEATPASLERTIRYAILKRQNEDALLAAKEELETRVQERTHELTEKNAALEIEIQERKRVEGELSEMQRRLLDQAESERLGLARDLHDGPMQELYGLIFQLETLPSDFESGKGGESIAKVKENLQLVIQSLRSISRELRPPALAPYGLEKAIRSHAAGLLQVHPDLQIDLYLDPDGRELPENARLALFRIYQTAISNVLRHAQASRVVVRFTMEEKRARLLIRDNGRGFYVPKRWIVLARQGHMGLVGAAERAEAFGGTLKVESETGKGTTIEVIIPRNHLPV